MEAGVGNFVVRSTDHDPGTAYSTANGLLNTDVSFAATKNVEFFVSHKMVMRDGVHQGLTMSHCANCHVESYGRKLDQTTNTLAAGARVNAGRFTMDYTFENRRFEENAPTPTNTYDNAIHPVTLADVFLSRVQYDDGNGPLTFDLFPKFTKQTSTVRAAYALPGDGAVSGNFTHSSSTNDYSDFGSDFTGGHARVTIPLGKRAYLKGLFRKYEIETESVFVDVVEPTAPAGPAAGLTYAQQYPAMLPLDYNTESAASRSPTEMALELAFRPGKRSSINLGYEYEEITRETFHVEKTTTNLFKASAYWRPDKTLNLRARYEQAMTSDPFANINARQAGRPAVGADAGRPAVRAAVAAVLRDVQLADGQPLGAPDRHAVPRGDGHLVAVAARSRCRATTATATRRTTSSTTRRGATRCTCPASRSTWRRRRGSRWPPDGATRRTRWTRCSARSTSVVERAASPGPSWGPCSIRPVTRARTRTRS